MGVSGGQSLSLTQWSKEHIRRIFESTTDEDAMRAVEKTFSKEVDATINGRKITFEHIMESVLSIRKDACYAGLQVQWHQTVEAPTARCRQEGLFGGTYSIEGIQRVLPGDEMPKKFTRQKTVIARIESQPRETTGDGRRIVHLTFVAADFPDT